MDSAALVKKNTGGNIWKMLQIAGLAFAIPFEIAAGPFIGYLIGLYLLGRFDMHRSVMYIFVILGFIASITNTAAIIKMMLVINKGNARGADAKN